MRKLISFFYGILLGILAGVGVVILLAPVSGKTFRENLRQHYNDAMQSAREAAQAKRSELEAELLQEANNTDDDSKAA